MTWLTSWPVAGIPQYAEHDSEAAAEAHAAELVRSKRAYYAVAFWASGVGVVSERIEGTADKWQTLTIRFRPPCDLAKPTGYAESVTTPVAKALLEAFDLESVHIDEVWLGKSE